jgi:hypothetical protein
MFSEWAIPLVVAVAACLDATARLLSFSRDEAQEILREAVRKGEPGTS